MVFEVTHNDSEKSRSCKMISKENKLHRNMVYDITLDFLKKKYITLDII